MKKHIKIAAPIHHLIEKLLLEEAKFNEGNASAGTRARKLLQEIKALATTGRKEIQENKNAV